MTQKNTLLLDVLNQKPVPRPPIWIMRQAGRYMPAYRQLRQSYSFLEMIQTPDLATEITLQPINYLGTDAAILFSDILVTAQALGSDLDYIEGTGPVISNPIRSMADVYALNTQGTTEKLSYVTTAIRQLKGELSVPLIGFAGAPFTVASYMIEGGSSHTLKTVKTLRYNDQSTFIALLEALTEVTIDYLIAQIDAGVDAIQLFDTWANHLTWDDFNQFSLTYMKTIIQAIRKHSSIPIILFCKNAGLLWPLLQDINPSAISFDWTGHIPRIRQNLTPSIAMQGNIDPYLLYGSPSMIQQSVTHFLNQINPTDHLIVNLGHGILPDMRPEHVKTLVDTVQSYAYKTTYQSV